MPIKSIIHERWLAVYDIITDSMSIRFDAAPFPLKLPPIPSVHEVPKSLRSKLFIQGMDKGILQVRQLAAASFDKQYHCDVMVWEKDLCVP